MDQEFDNKNNQFTQQNHTEPVGQNNPNNNNNLYSNSMPTGQNQGFGQPSGANSQQGGYNYQGYGYDYQSQFNQQQNAYASGGGGQFIPPNNNSPQSGGKKPKNDKKRGSHGMGSIVAVALVCAIIGGGIGSAVTYAVQPHSASSASQIQIDDSYKSSVEAIAAKDLPSVVGVVISYPTSHTTTGVLPFFGGQQQQSGQDSTLQDVSEGSGVIYKDNGYIITNYHVVADAVSNSNAVITVYLNDSTDQGYQAKVVGYDAGADLAVLKIDASGLTPIEIGNSDDIQVGQTAIAIGNPGGMDFMGSVSEGIVSGLNRSVTLESGVEMNLIQTDASINPGNSGGALVDGTGKLIGISSAKLASENFEGMGFAIPVNNVVEICDQLIANEGKTSPYLGVTLDTRYTPEVLQRLGYPSGVVVNSVTENSPAAVAGIKAGDIITKVGDTATPSADVLKSELAKYNVGDVVPIEIYRLGATTTVQVTLAATTTQQ